MVTASAEVIGCVVRLYFRFQLSLRDIDELLFERGVVVTYETIRCWCYKFARGFIRHLLSKAKPSCHLSRFPNVS